jgi:hypothetical protein
MTADLNPLIPPLEIDVLVDGAHSSAGGPLPDTGSCTSGISKKFISWRHQNLLPVLEFLNGLDYGPNLQGGGLEGDAFHKATDHWDCDDKAFWAIAHARRKFTGLPMAIAEGTGRVGGVAGQPHAIVVIWREKDPVNHEIEHIYYDPALPGLDRVILDKTNGFGPIERITAFPISKRSAGIIIDPLDKIGKDFFGHSITMDAFVRFYPMKGKDNNGVGVLDFLENGLHDKSCIDKDSHGDLNPDDIFYTDADSALWTFVHVRRSFPGCAIGVALGIPVDGASQAVNMIWEHRGKKSFLWDPKINNGKGGLVNDFKILASFM